MKRLIAALAALAAMTVACGGGPNPAQLKVLARAEAQEQGWRPLFTYDSGGYILIVACREKGEAQGTVSALLVNEAPQIATVDAIVGATCKPTPTATSTPAAP